MNKAREQPIIIIKKKVYGHGHHGGAWKVAFADFMTAMFALFLVLWLVNQSSDVKAAIAGYFQDPLGRADEYGSSILKGEGAQTQMARPLAQTQVIDIRVDRLTRLAVQIKEKLAKVPALDSILSHVEITLTEEGLRIELLEDSTAMFFESGSAKLSTRGQQLLQMLGRELATENNRVEIEGHTDARPYVSRTGYSNWELSVDRANSARRVMERSGLKQAQVISVRGHADRQLRFPAEPLDARNRRVSIVVKNPVATNVAPPAPPQNQTPAAPAPTPAAPAAQH